MSDPLRTDASHAPDGAPDADPEAKIEQLLLTGLEHYFASHYEQAINVWSRALFLDRGHARARAYIERARGALAERQRESEELLQGGKAALQRGEADEARRLVEQAIALGAPSDEALPLLERINRLHPLVPIVTPSARPARVRTATALAERAPRASRAAWVALGFMGLVILAAGAFAGGLFRSDWRLLLDRRPGPVPGPIRAVNGEGLPLPRRGETALTRARALVASGRLRDALLALDLVQPTDPERTDADRLRADIQRQLIAVGAASATTGPDTGSLRQP